MLYNPIGNENNNHTNFYVIFFLHFACRYQNKLCQLWAPPHKSQLAPNEFINCWISLRNNHILSQFLNVHVHYLRPSAH